MLPLAAPSIMAGVRTRVVVTVGTATLAERRLRPRGCSGPQQRSTQPLQNTAEAGIASGVNRSPGPLPLRVTSGVRDPGSDCCAIRYVTNAGCAVWPEGLSLAV
jgi:hypothetical protein